MSTALASIFPILLALLLGYAYGWLLPGRGLVGRLLGPLVWVLLFSIGCEFGAVLDSGQQLRQAVQLALAFAVATCLVPMLLIGLLLRRELTAVASLPFSLRLLAGPARECAISLGMVAAGVLAAHWQLGESAWLQGVWLPGSEQLLYLLVFLVGIDLTGVRLSRALFARQMIAIPLLVVIGSWVAALLLAALLDLRVQTALALSSGFGWFSLSGILVGQYLGEAYGLVAMLTDLLRELLAILLLYLFGNRHARACVGAAGATALDSTLPIIKQTCPLEVVPLALVSGLLLTLLAPLLMTLFLAF